jgi:hypothetical protein
MRTQLDLTPGNILDFARKYSFYPPDQAQGYAAQNQTMLAGQFTGFRHTRVNTAQKVVHIDVVRQQNQMANRAADFLIQPSLTATTGTPAYFLPWDARGAAVEMTIPRFPAAGGNATTNPPIFFTAVLSGCSIVFKGTPDKPTIFHCGTAGGGAGADTAGDSNQFFRTMLRDIRGQGLGRSNHPVSTQVLSTDYMTTRAGGGLAPAHEATFKNTLQVHYKDDLYIENVNMWGCIFGFRTGVNWEFYLQENATISYRKVNDIIQHFATLAMQQKNPRPFDISTLTPAQLLATNIPVALRARPAVVTRVFPGGAAVATVTTRWKTIKT